MLSGKHYQNRARHASLNQCLGIGLYFDESTLQLLNRSPHDGMLCGKMLSRFALFLDQFISDCHSEFALISSAPQFRLDRKRLMNPSSPQAVAFQMNGRGWLLQLANH